MEPDYLAGFKAFLVMSLALSPISCAALLVKATNSLFDDDPPTGCIITVLLTLLASLFAAVWIGWWAYHSLAVGWK